MSAVDIEEIDLDSDAVDELVGLGDALIMGILERAPFNSVKALVDAGAPLWFQDDEGTSALHAAAYVEDAELIEYLIGEGAIWNAMDGLQNTAADIALSLNNEPCYTLIRNAGIRSELLLSLLSSRAPAEGSSLANVLKVTDATPAGSTDAFLSSSLKYTQDENGQDICMVRINETEEVGVMMGWERPIMQATVQKLCADHPNLPQGLKVLNVGFGLGIIDSLFQSFATPPLAHVIIEPHPDVHKYMRKNGWYDKPGVTILEGKWQDFMEDEKLLSFGGFDVVYTDTFSEDYKALKEFFGHVPDLLADAQSRVSFFNGLGATNPTFYDVYTRLSDLHLAEVGIEVEWSDLDVFQGSQARWGETRQYFGQRIYRLPIGKMKAI